ncbi:DUF885 domain-containing protein [Mitsuaria sp. GD03876]|uniref:DUF885 domain-containing protein n=1 Tax=Mitsuaria sp. GD03876 TaxID=2975399 RepID=UPI00244D2130|nr:DUF885 domain-containing protein [Mitsuaria sp. GD03876]MDH0866259.1 DUF885 domain-containing protein [Mitsuaria sp. GD03876]
MNTTISTSSAPSASSTSSTMATPSTSFDDLCRRYWAFQCDEFPIAALLAGEASPHELLIRDAPADHERRAERAGALLAEALAVDRDALDAERRISAALLERELRLMVDEVATLAHLRPSLYPLGPEATLQGYAQSATFAGVDDARRFNQRLRRIPEVFGGLQATLRHGVERGIRWPRIVLERALAAVRGAAAIDPAQSPFFSPFRRVAADGRFDEAAREGLALIADQVLPALLGYAAFLEGVLGDVAQDATSCLDNPMGAEFYRHRIREFTTLDADPAEVHAFGLAEVARLSAAMSEVARAAGHDTLAAFVAALKADPAQFAPSGEALREQIEVLSKRIDARMPEFFGRLPRMSYGVQSIPEAIAAGMPPAYAQANPADGSAAGIHWVTSLPERCPAYMHIPLALHEAWPGHLMHLALMQEMTALPEFRRHGAYRYSACLEGWALYCEALGEDLRLYDTPAKRYGRLEMEMWRAVRLVVDTGLHLLRWSRDEAVQYMARHMAMPLPTLEAEVDRYVGMPAQALGYQLGNQRFRELRAHATARLGDRFSLRRFHDALMAAGPVTLDVLREVIAQWIERESNRAPARDARST